MDILQVQDRLKNFSQDQLVGEMQAPSGSAPQFLVLSEIMRRKRLQDDFAAQQGKAGSESTVAQEAVAAAGVPQGGIADMARAMAPSTDMTQNTGVQAMASGGTVKKMQVGGAVMTDPAIISMANRSGMTVEEYLGSLRPEEAARLQRYATDTATRERMKGLEPIGNPPVQEPEVGQFEPVNPSYVERPSVFPNDTVRPPTGPLTEYQPLYNPLEMLDRNKLPVDQIPPRPVAPADRPGALANVVPYTAEEFTTTMEDFTGPVKDYFSSPDEMVRGVDPYTGKVIDIPTLGTQFRQAGRGIAEGATTLVDKAGEALSSLPAFDMARGDPYSELTEAEKSALYSNKMHPSEADRIQAERLAAKTAGGAGRADRDQQGIAAIPTAPETEKPAGPASEQPMGPASEQPVGPAAEQPAGPQGGGGTGGGSGIAGAASGMTSYEQELMDALARREQAATQDKWLSLAQVGLNLMSSTNPTFGGALGEAGLAGVQAAQGARDQYDKDRLELTGALEQSRMSRAAAAAAAARGAGGAKMKPINATLIGNFEKKLADVQGQLSMLPPPPEPGWWSGTIDDPDAVAREDLARQAAGLQQILAQAYATHGIGVGAPEAAYDGDMSDPEE